MSNNEDVMFLFGAGISIPIGIPAMEGIYNAFMNRKKSGISQQNVKICEFFTREMGVNKDLEEFLLAANTIIEFRNSGLSRFVENNISKAASSKKLKEFNKNLDASVNDVINVRKDIVEFLSRMCFQFDREKSIKVNAGFVSTLSKLGYPVYSTNYDYAFEYVAIENEIQIIDNFTKKGQRYLWNNNIDFESANEDDAFRLIKLHGSVTWYVDESNTIEKMYSNTDINSIGKNVEKIIIVPTRFKDIYAQHFFSLYSHFLSSLARSKVIIIAGHSLRDDYLRAGILERKRKGGFQVIVIDPAYPPEIKKELPPSRLGTSGEVVHLPYKWEEISDELSSILVNSEPDQISDNCTHILRKHKYTKNKVKIKGNVGVFRVLEVKTISVDVEAYLSPNNRPSNLRVWLKASYVESDGTAQKKISSEFIEVHKIEYGTGLTGLIKETIRLEVKPQKYQRWLREDSKVTIVVGLVRPQAKTPLGVRGRNLIAKTEKKINYKI
ncbi:MAG: SIR2 family protein [Calditrichales bacterium]|nr:SIR2 family protein [Calditrichales bacterium]